MNIREYICSSSEEYPLDRIVTDGGMCAIFRSICCIGDSLSSGEFEAVNTNSKKSYHDMFDYSWGQYIARSTGAKVLNFSRGGMTAQEYCETFAQENGFWSKDLLCQAYIIALGVNDLLNPSTPVGSVSDVDLDDYNNNTKNFAGYYAKIIQRIKSMQPNAKFFLMTMLSGKDRVAESTRTAHAKFLYDLADMFDNTYVIDLYKYGPEQTDEYIQRYMMGGHLSAAGYLLTARMVESYIDYIIRHNPQDFKEVPFIGTGLSFYHPESIDKKADIESYYKEIKSTIPIVKHVPEFDPVSPYNIKAVTVSGADYKGNKTKFFAYMGFPENADENTPGIVLIHGGGGHAYLQWAEMWVQRGYSVIVPDTVGHFPMKNTESPESIIWHHGIYGIFCEDGYVAPPNNDDMINSHCKPFEERWMTHITAQCMLSYSALIQSEKSSQSKTGISGISWGGVAVSIALGFDDRFAFAIPVYGSGYLNEALSWMKEKFAHPQTHRYFLAQDRFDRVNIPIMWLCWNDDFCFSINSNSKSYYQTVKNNEKTVISIVNGMFHSHEFAWQRCESMEFADSIVKGAKQLPRFTSLPDGTSCDCVCKYDGKLCATLYYIKDEFTYSSHVKYGMCNTFLDPDWMYAPIDCSNGVINGTLPQDAKYYYIEVQNENGVVISTPLISRKTEEQ